MTSSGKWGEDACRAHARTRRADPQKTQNGPSRYPVVVSRDPTEASMPGRRFPRGSPEVGQRFIAEPRVYTQ